MSLILLIQAEEDAQKVLKKQNTYFGKAEWFFDDCTIFFFKLFIKWRDETSTRIEQQYSLACLTLHKCVLIEKTTKKQKSKTKSTFTKQQAAQRTNWQWGKWTRSSPAKTLKTGWLSSSSNNEVCQRHKRRIFLQVYFSQDRWATSHTLTPTHTHSFSVSPRVTCTMCVRAR